MAIERIWTGFEGGESCGPMISNPPVGGTIGDGTARTGEFYCKHFVTTPYSNTYQIIRHLNTTLGTGMVQGDKVRVNFRVFYRINVDISSDVPIPCGGIGYGGESWNGKFMIDKARRIRAYVYAKQGISSAIILSLKQWYRIDLKFVGERILNGYTQSISVSIYTEDGTLLETLTSFISIPSIPPNFTPTCALGNDADPPSTFDMDYDDLYIEWRDKADAVQDFAFPTATRVTRVPATSQSILTNWTGDWRIVTSIPLPRSATSINGVGEQSSSVAGATTTFKHAGADSLRLGNIQGVRVGVVTKSSTLGADAILLNGVEYPFGGIIADNYTTTEGTGTDFREWTYEEFDSMEFGMRNKRGSVLKLAKCYLEVLHDGLNTTAEPATFAYLHKVVSWVGNGTYQTVGGVGFRPQAMIICSTTVGPSNQSGDSVFKIGNFGTLAWQGSGTRSVINGVLGLTSDGIILGPHISVNKNGVAYSGIFFQMGDRNDASCGMWMSDDKDNRNIVLNPPIKPDIVLVSAGYAWRTIAMGPGDISGGLYGTTSVDMVNKIQTLNDDGFQLGTGSYVSGFPAGDFQSTKHYIAFKINNSKVIATGKVSPTGPTFTVSGLAFSPVWVFVQVIDNGDPAFYRFAGAFTGANSRSFFGDDSTLAITSLNSDGFTCGSRLSVVGRNVYWVAFAGMDITGGGGGGGSVTDITGLHYINPKKTDRHDSYNGGVEKKIPDPVIRTGLIGE